MLVLQALRELPLEQQIVLELNLLEGLPGAEISELLNIPEGTVRSRLRLGLKRLKARVAEIAASPAEQASTLSDLAAWARNVRQARGRRAGRHVRRSRAAPLARVTARHLTAAPAGTLVAPAAAHTPGLRPNGRAWRGGADPS